MTESNILIERHLINNPAADFEAHQRTNECGKCEHTSASPFHSKATSEQEDLGHPYVLQVKIVDFGDARLADPLYDFVALHTGSLYCSTALLSEFLAGYLQDAEPASWGQEATNDSAGSFKESIVCLGSPGDNPAYDSVTCSQQLPSHMNDKADVINVEEMCSYQPSYRAMCFTLLHDQDVLEYVSKHHPKWGELDSWHEMASRMWGVLDKYSCLRDQNSASS